MYYETFLIFVTVSKQPVEDAAARTFSLTKALRLTLS